MNALLNLYPGDPLVLMAASVLAQVTAVCLITLFLVRTIARHSPAARHGLGMCALLCILSSPAIASGVDRVGRPLIDVPLLAPGHAPPAVSATSGATQTVHDLVPQALRGLSVEGFIRAAGGILLVLWGCGVGLWAARIANGWRAVSHLRRSIRAVDTRALAPLLEEVRQALGMRRLPEIGTSPAVPVPIALGPLRPIVVLPESFMETLSAEQLRDVLIHECAHVAEGHHWSGLLLRLTAALFWPHPLVHHLEREIARAREEVCDNYVLRCTDAPHYARTLLQVAVRGAGSGEHGASKPADAGCRAPKDRTPNAERRTPAARFPLYAPRSTTRRSTTRLETRVAGLLDRRRERRTQLGRWNLAGLMAAFLAVGISIAGTRVTRADAPQPSAETRQVGHSQSGRQTKIGVRLETPGKAGLAGGPVRGR